MSKTFKEYLTKIPEDFELLLKALGNKTRIRIVLLLLKNESLSLSKIVKYTNQENSLVLNHIKKLELAGVVQNYIQKREGRREFSFYELTKYGKKIITDLVENYNNFYGNLNKTNKLINFEYQYEIPEDFELTFKALSNKYRFALSILLINEGTFSFSEIVNILEREKSSISNHLKKLELGGIIQNFLEKNEKTGEYSFYKITVYGKEIISGLLKSYNDYYKGLTDVIEEYHDEMLGAHLKHFDANSNSWALPNEKILAWIEVYTENVARLEIKLSENLIINEFFNIGLELKNDSKIISIELNKNNPKYIPFEFYSKIPDANNQVNLEKLIINAYDFENILLGEKEITIEILKPLVKLEVINKQKTPNSGFFEIKISCLRDFQIKILNIEIKVTDSENNPIEIKTTQKDPLELEQEIPPEIQLENLIGELILHGKGIFKFHFRIPYLDRHGNKHYSNIEVIELKNIEEFEANLNYIYNYTTEGATA